MTENITPRKDFVAARVSKVRKTRKQIFCVVYPMSRLKVTFIYVHIFQIDEANQQGRINNDTLAANLKWKADDPERLKRDRSKSGNRKNNNENNNKSVPEPKKSGEPIRLSTTHPTMQILPPRKTAPAGVITIDRRNQMV